MKLLNLTSPTGEQIHLDHNLVNGWGRKGDGIYIDYDGSLIEVAETPERIYELFQQCHLQSGDSRKIKEVHKPVEMSNYEKGIINNFIKTLESELDGLIVSKQRLSTTEAFENFEEVLRGEVRGLQAALSIIKCFKQDVSDKELKTNGGA